MKVLVTTVLGLFSLTVSKWKSMWSVEALRWRWIRQRIRRRRTPMQRIRRRQITLLLRIRRRRITRGFGDGDFARPIWRKHWRNSSASPQCSNPANRRFMLKNATVVKNSVPRIRDILRRIRILTSIHWITDPDLDPTLDPDLSSVASKKQLFLLIVGTFTSV